MLESREINDSYRMQRTILSIALGLIFNISASPAWALNLGKGVLGSTLGQPLNFSVNVNSEVEEGITPECVGAEVYSGDNKLAPGAVRISNDGPSGATQFTLRVTTNTVIDEPVVTVAVALGCPTRVTRRFVLFVDPPVVAGNAEVVADPVFRPLPSDSASDLPKPITRPAYRPARSGVRTAPQANRPAPTVDGDTVSRPPRRNRNITPVQVPEGVAAPKPVLQRPPALAKAATPAASAPRLKLDSAPRVVTAPAPSASSATLLAEALAAKAAADAASASAASASTATSALQEAELRAARRVAALEESLLKLKAEALTSRKSIETLQATVREADARKTPSVLVWVLGALAATLAAAVAALLWLQARRRRNPSWWTGGSAEPHPANRGRSVSPETRSSRSMADAAEPGFGTAPFSASQRDSFTVASGPAPLASAAPFPSTSVKAVSTLATGFGAMNAAPAAPAATTKASDDFSAMGNSRELSVEELIDLEQQADFFVVLGQDEAAIDLLMTHVRSTGGLSPMPYMKLLEIYRRLGNHDAYERIRDRFNQRFNGDIPSAEADPEEGRSITDYPDTLGELIAVWPTPFKAVETLGRWLARSDSDAPGGSLAFDLPAYSELLFLHSLARDLSAREPSAGGIDVLLPLAMDPPSPIASLQATLPTEVPTQVPNLMTDSGYELDLDLSLPMPLPSNTKQTDYDNAGPKSDFMSLNIDSRFQS
jgi:pilus assembly protein FimV